MKKTFTCLASVLSLSIFIGSCSNSDEQSFSVDCLPSNLQTDILAFYAFGGGSLEDSSGNGHHLSNPTTATATTDRDGNGNCAFLFDSTGEHLIFEDPVFLDDLQNSDFSISLWYNEQSSGGVLVSRGIDFGNCHGGVGEWHVGIGNDALYMTVNSERALALQANFPVNVWHHVVYIKSADTFKIYYDGILLDSHQNNMCTEPGNSLNVGDLFIGGVFHGKLDDIIIYDRALDQSEVSQLIELNACCE